MRSGIICASILLAVLTTNAACATAVLPPPAKSSVVATNATTTPTPSKPTIAATNPTSVSTPPKPTVIASNVPTNSAPSKTADVTQTTNTKTPAPAASAANPSAPAQTAQPTPVTSMVMPPPGMTAVQQKQIEDIIHYYLVKNPEVIIEAVQALQQKQLEEAHKAVQKTQENAPKLSDGIFHQANDPIIGNATGKVTVVDFFDYQCPHCTKMTPILESLTKTNPQLRVVFKEFPIRGPLSEYASKVVLAAKLQGKYFELHKALMVLSDQQALTEDAILKAAKTLGLNIDKLKIDMKSDSISTQIKNNVKLGQDLQLLGTPAFFIAKTAVTSKNAKVEDIKFIPGQVDQVQLQGIVTTEEK